MASLGATCVWLMPLYPTPNRDDGYDITDYLGVDPRLGDVGEVVEAIRHATDRGLRVLADLVVNHTSDEHPWFRAACADRRSPYRDFYVWTDDPGREKGTSKENWAWSEEAGQWYMHQFAPFQPDLNIADPAVRDEIAKTVGFWLKLGVSGFRMDAVPFLVQELDARGDEESGAGKRWLHALREYAMRRRGDVMLMGECNVAMEEVPSFFEDHGDALHLQLAFLVNQRLWLALARGEAAPLESLIRELPLPPRDCGWATFLRNHDELTLDKLTETERDEVFAAFAPDEDMRIYGHGIRRRAASMLGGDGPRLRMAWSLMMSAARIAGDPLRRRDRDGRGPRPGRPDGRPDADAVGAGAGAGSRRRRRSASCVPSSEGRSARTRSACRPAAHRGVAAEVVTALVRRTPRAPELGLGTSRLLENARPACSRTAATGRARRSSRSTTSPTAGDRRAHPRGGRHGRGRPARAPRARRARRPPPGRARRLRVPVAARPAVRGGAQGPTSDRRTYVTSRRAWLMWGLGVAAYGVAVFHRASLGVAGPEAQQRFGASAAVLSLFVVLQLAVYAGLQVPVGAVLDRVGSRRMVAAGAAVMGIGQIVLAESHSVGLAAAGRVLVGAGDAMTFTSVLRLVAAWFPARRVPVVTQLTGLLGQGGQLAAAIPLVALLHVAGWTTSFLAVGVAGLAVAALVAAGPARRAAVGARPRAAAGHGAGPAPPARGLARARHAPGPVDALLDAVLGHRLRPALGLSVPGAGRGPLARRGGRAADGARARGRRHRTGPGAARRPLALPALDPTLTVVGASALTWTVVLTWPGPAPLALLVVLVLVLATNGPGSMIGFDYARTENEPGAWAPRPASSTSAASSRRCRRSSSSGSS